MLMKVSIASCEGRAMARAPRRRARDPRRGDGEGVGGGVGEERRERRKKKEGKKGVREATEPCGVLIREVCRMRCSYFLGFGHIIRFLVVEI
jgi:hypothetical protein